MESIGFRLSACAALLDHHQPRVVFSLGGSVEAWPSSLSLSSSKEMEETKKKEADSIPTPNKMTLQAVVECLQEVRSHRCSRLFPLWTLQRQLSIGLGLPIG